MKTTRTQPRSSTWSSSSGRALARAFTLVELMVALTGGLIFSVFVFMLTRDVSRFFQQETGLSDATTGILAGYQRLRADVQRAGFLSSPNFAKDMGRCPARSPTGALDLANITGGNWATYDLLRELALARVTAGATTSTWLTATGLAPDQLTLYGNYTTADQYPVRSFAGNAIYLDPNSEELARAGYSATTATATLALVFPVGTILRVVSANTGEEQYTIVAGTAAATAATPTVNIQAVMPLIVKAAGSSCGIRGLGADLLINPVNIVRYRMGSLAANASFAALYPGTGGSAGIEATWPRFDLLREELDPRSSVTTPIAQELVVEYAVDFRVGVQAVTNTTTHATTYYEAGDSNVAAFLGLPTAAAATASEKGPHMVRGLRPRLAVRTRAPDRQANVVSGAGLYRVPLTAASGGTGAGDFARVRTLQSLIMTRNTRSRVWN